MDAMYDAIKKRRGGPGEIGESAPEKGADLLGFVAALSDEEKGALKMLLDKGSASQDIQKGGPSTEESAAIEGAIAEENEENALVDAEDDVDSDAIGASMLDSRFTGAGPMPKPRNLGERVKTGIAQKLKSKGKI